MRPTIALRKPLLILLILVFTVAGAYLAKRWWNKRTYISDLPQAQQVIDAQPKYFAALFECPQNQPECPQRITSIGPYQLRILGNPAATRYPRNEEWPARTPWDLHAVGQRLYMGLGDASNEGPTANAGPVPLIYYNIESGQFIEETILPEEQIDRFFLIDNQLMIPGEDPRASWDWGNLYVQQASGQWQQRRTLPRFIHAHALAFHQGKLYAGGNIPDAVPFGLGEQRHGSAIAASADLGVGWLTTGLGGLRITDFLHVKDQLYATDAFPGSGLQSWLDKQGRQDFFSPVYQLDAKSNWNRRTDLTPEVMLPSTALAGQRMATIERSIHWQGQSLYIAAFVAQPGNRPVRAAYMASDLDRGHVNVKRLPFDDATQVWDSATDRATDGRTLWLSTAKQLADGRWLNQLHHSNDGRQWKTIAGFKGPTYASSFAMNGEAIYWGLAGQNYAGIIVEFIPTQSSR